MGGIELILLTTVWPCILLINIICGSYVPLEKGETMCKEELAAPALSPNSVILFGSPPKLAMLSMTNWSAIC